MSLSQRQWKKGRHEKGYPWLFFYAGQSWRIGLLVTIIVTSAASAFYRWYWQTGNDIAPDSIVGYGYAIGGTLCFMLAALLYTARRRSNKRAMGQLNATLNWHIFFAFMGIAFLLMHSFGNFNAKTGTYALYSLVALMVSGFVGRALDHVMPRLIAREVDTVLTAEGEDRIEAISRNPKSSARKGRQFISLPLSGIDFLGKQRDASGSSRGGSGEDEGRKRLRRPGEGVAFRSREQDESNTSAPFTPMERQPFSGSFSQNWSLKGRQDQSMSTPWDMAYVSPGPAPHKIAHHHPAHYHRESNLSTALQPHKSQNPRRTGILVNPAEMVFQAQDTAAEIESIQRAIQREQFYRYVIRYWRLLHIAMAFLTAGLIIWHLVYVAQLLIPTFFHHV